MKFPTQLLCTCMISDKQSDYRSRCSKCPPPSCFCNARPQTWTPLFDLLAKLLSLFNLQCLEATDVTKGCVIHPLSNYCHSSTRCALRCVCDTAAAPARCTWLQIMAVGWQNRLMANVVYYFKIYWNTLGCKLY